MRVLLDEIPPVDAAWSWRNISRDFPSINFGDLIKRKVGYVQICPISVLTLIAFREECVFWIPCYGMGPGLSLRITNMTSPHVQQAPRRGQQKEASGPEWSPVHPHSHREFFHIKHKYTSILFSSKVDFSLFPTHFNVNREHGKNINNGLK
jgi:hypothetical protein